MCQLLVLITSYRYTHSTSGDPGKYNMLQRWRNPLADVLQFSSLRTDAPGDRRSKNRSQNPPGGNFEGVATTEPASPLPGSSSRMTLRQYKKIFEWKALIGLAQDYLLGQILLDNAFPSCKYLRHLTAECLSEAQSEYPRLYPNFPLDSGLGIYFNSIKTSNNSHIYPTVSQHRPRIVEIVSPLPLLILLAQSHPPLDHKPSFYPPGPCPGFCAPNG